LLLVEYKGNNKHVRETATEKSIETATEKSIETATEKSNENQKKQQQKNQKKIKRNSNRKIKRKIKNPLVPVGGHNRYERLKEQNKINRNSEKTFGTGWCCEPVLKVTFRPGC
jgi:hypothetical protein